LIRYLIAKIRKDSKVFRTMWRTKENSVQGFPLLGTQPNLSQQEYFLLGPQHDICFGIDFFHLSRTQDLDKKYEHFMRRFFSRASSKFGSVKRTTERCHERSINVYDYLQLMSQRDEGHIKCFRIHRQRPLEGHILLCWYAGNSTLAL